MRGTTPAWHQPVWAGGYEGGAHTLAAATTTGGAAADCEIRALSLPPSLSCVLWRNLEVYLNLFLR